MRARELAAHYRAKAAQMRARLRAIKRADFRETVLGVAQTKVGRVKSRNP